MEDCKSIGGNQNLRDLGANLQLSTVKEEENFAEKTRETKEEALKLIQFWNDIFGDQVERYLRKKNSFFLRFSLNSSKKNGWNISAVPQAECFHSKE